jgi:hypothetical protein
MNAPFISSDPHAWLRPYYAELVARGGFGLLAPALQFQALIDAFAVDHPSKVADYQGWNDAGQRAFLSWLAEVTTERPPTRETELWRMRKGERTLRCAAVHIPTGIDLRLFEGSDFLRTALTPDAPAAHAKASEWKRALRARGWLHEPTR